jgi:hypothetical protein
MADPLRSAQGSNQVSQAGYLEFIDSYADADKAVADAVADRKDLRAKIKAAGIPLAAFDRSRRDSEKSGEIREAEEIWYRRMMTWRQKPVGFQASMDMAAGGAVDPGLAALSTSELKRIDMEGFEAGKGGRRKDSNSYTPGTEAYQRWDTAWLRGQAEIASTLGDPAPKRGRGRPPKAAEAPANGAKRGRGRPRKDQPALALVEGTGEQQPDATQH